MLSLLYFALFAMRNHASYNKGIFKDNKSKASNPFNKEISTRHRTITEQDLSSVANRVSLPTDDGAVCLDGSAANYYFREGIKMGKTKYLLFHQGGGWCHSNNGEVNMSPGMDSCAHRSSTRLGSNNLTTQDIQDKIVTDWKGRGYLTDDERLNPMMYQWNTAVLLYCDGSSYSSDLEEPVIITNEKGEEIKLYHRGYRILKAFIKDLYDNKGLNDATEIVIAGESAGGLAVYLHIENINQLIQQLDVVSNNADHKYKIRGLIDSGIFPVTEQYEQAMTWIYDNLNVTQSINQECIKENKEQGYKCMFGINLIKYIEIPIFIVGSVNDIWQIDNQVIWPDIDKIAQHSIDLQQAVTSQYNPTDANRNALWLYRCYAHTGCFDTAKINDRYLLDVFSDWYNGIEDKYEYKYVSEYEQDVTSCMECENLPTSIDHLCIGFNQYPFDRYPNGTDKLPWNELDFNKTMGLVKKMNPSCVRINFYIHWFFDINYSKKPFEKSFIHYSTNEMRAVFKVLDWYRDNLPNTKIMTGLWHIKGLEYSSDESAELQTMLVKYLIHDKGYNIKYYTPTNEPKGEQNPSIPVQTWCELIHKLYDKFKENDIDTEILTGPDSWDDYTYNAYWQCKEDFYAFDHHLYPRSKCPYDSEEIVSGRMKVHLLQQAWSHGLITRLDRKRDMGLTEMSMFPAEGNCGVDNPNEGELNAADDFEYAIDLADYFIQAVTTGHTMIMYWCLDGFDMNKNCGFWDNRDKKYNLHPWYFIWKLISNYFGSYGTVKIVNYKQPKYGRILLMQQITDDKFGKYKWSMLIINRGRENIEIKLDDLKANNLDIEGLKTFIVEDIYEDRKDEYIVETKYDNDNPLKDDTVFIVKPNTAVVITNKEQVTGISGTLPVKSVSTQSPTKNPTSKDPSQNPTKSPTKGPSKKPTTSDPTNDPTKLITNNPTGNPVNEKDTLIVDYEPPTIWGNVIYLFFFCLAVFCCGAVLKCFGGTVIKKE